MSIVSETQWNNVAIVFTSFLNVLDFDRRKLLQRFVA
jgi:hypothetical protein